MIDIDIKFGNLLSRLGEMKKRGENMEPIFAEIGNIIVESVEENFAVEGRHNGDPLSIMGGSLSWDEWSNEWRARREKMGKLGKILQLDGGLASSIDYSAEKSGVIISAGKKYAARQHFGDGTPGRGIPARPFLVIQEEDLEESLEAIGSFLVGDP